MQVIAEAGVNHNGDIDLAHELVDAAVRAGADYVKFQTFDAKRIVTLHAPKAAYQVVNDGTSETQFEMLRRLQLSAQDHHCLLEHCSQSGIEFLSTPFDIESLDLLLELKMRVMKVASGEITNLPLLRKIGQQNLRLIVSTGMSTLDEVEAAVTVLEQSGTDRKRITILHCNTEYPTPLSDVNLRAMANMRDTLQCDVGYSDHTEGIEIPVAAVALGATVIEKHLTISRQLPGPDHSASLEPPEFARMVDAIRGVESAIGNGIKCPSASELPNRAVARKSIVASRTIKVGELLGEANLTVKRPGTGISPMMWDAIVGRRANRDYQTDEQIQW